MGRRSSCKHILFILHRVLKIARDNLLLCQVAFLNDELNLIFRNAPVPPPNALADAAVRKQYAEITGQSVEELEAQLGQAVNAVSRDDAGEADSTELGVKQKEIDRTSDCVICCETLLSQVKSTSTSSSSSKDASSYTSTEAIVYCKAQCRNSIHASCFEQWRTALKKQHSPVTCPLCRTLWFTEGTSTSKSKATTDNVYGVTYVNLSQYSHAHANQDLDAVYSGPTYYTGSRFRYY
jgi:hypothetical protein